MLCIDGQWAADKEDKLHPFQITTLGSEKPFAKSFDELDKTMHCYSIYVWKELLAEEYWEKVVVLKKQAERLP